MWAEVLVLGLISFSVNYLVSSGCGYIEKCTPKPQKENTWRIIHKCNEKPNGVDSGKKACVKFFGNLGYDRNSNTVEKRRKNCEKYQSTPAIPKTCPQFGVVMSQKCSADQIYVGAYSDNNAKSFRWDDDMHFATTEWQDIWYPRQPDNSGGRENCVTVMRGHLNDLPCNYYATCACQICHPVSKIPKSGQKLCSNPTTKKLTFTSSTCSSPAITFEASDYKNNASYPYKKMCDMLPCASFRWGPECKHQCFCKNYEACHQETGKCPTDECVPGFFGEKCNRNGCALNRWGPNCEKVCLCKNKEVCHPVIGLCALGCEEGAVGPSCDGVLDACPAGKYGTACDKRCRCKGICTKEEGLCVSGCADGWFGAKCDTTECPVGRWGKECEKYCACADDVACDVNTGECSGSGTCAPGWSGDACDKGPDGKCEKDSTKCPGSDVFKSDCPPPYWGSDCSFECKNKNCAVCTKLVKWKGTRCETCLPGLAFKDGLCDTTCTDALLYGSPCNKTCSKFCGGDGSCNETTGACLKGCKSYEPGYKDPETCFEKKEKEDPFPWWIVGAAVFTALATCCVLLAFLAKRRNKKHEEEQVKEDKDKGMENIQAEGQGLDPATAAAAGMATGAVVTGDATTGEAAPAAGGDDRKKSMGRRKSSRRKSSGRRMSRRRKSSRRKSSAASSASSASDLSDLSEEGSEYSDESDSDD